MVKIKITNPQEKIKIPVPVKFSVPDDITGNYWVVKNNSGKTCVAQRLHNDPDHNFVAIVNFSGPEEELSFDHEIEEDKVKGIKEIPQAKENDAYVHLNTGKFDFELCRGTAQGEGSSKWGLRHFMAVDEKRDLLPSGNNAMGGFYGPFFTPDNGLINPAEHLIVDIKPIENGPVMKEYRLSGRIPDGLKPELHGKRFALDWSFYYDVPFFSRVYHVDHFQTTVNQRSIVDKITVGDEFESGIGQLVFDRFATYDGVWYREGDPYSGQLANKVQELVHDGQKRSNRFEDFRKQLTSNMANAHWDLYWRLFSVWENALSQDEIETNLHDVRQKAFVLAELNDRPWLFSADPVNVSEVKDQTVFAGPATKSAEINTQTGQAMVWQTEHASNAFQIVQRPQSGWQNWGTNAENECPSLPVGTLIHTAYGPYQNNWREVADSLEALADVTAEVE
ncbi:hypothetical protein NX781_06240 [Lactobacillus kullabergensis]|uniref:hypothetical protein n=1 Tax=Lactobacillus TaxID=1578 RepID=UPI0018DD2195|nr:MULTISPECIES: hypothetical protein [Lactobacillus]MBI0121875.1 hypothetical protein [Lactobacillus sp. M0398]MBI0123786.1 hypothetical protein [Lactobacillus sp. W8174]MBI0135920.1 hypothetical protein [Lactobacillus sp. W8173]MCX0291388.1 hypothetical protein [Lactobacillus kullabergensis]